MLFEKPSKYTHKLLEKIEISDAILVGATAGMSAACGFNFFYQNDSYFQKYLGEFHKKYGYTGAFNGFYYRYPSSEARWAFLARMGYMEYECETGKPYYDLMELLAGKNYHIMTTNQDFQFTRVVPEEKLSAIQGDSRYFQCSRRCHDEIFYNKDMVYAIDARVPSILIAGGANFPVRQKEKQNAARDRNMAEWRDIQGLLDKIRSTGMGGISADDPQAIAKLESKLAGLEQSQERMKDVNAYYRKHKSLDNCPLLSPEQIEQVKADMARSWRLEDKPYPTWMLSNNSAEIRRVKGRIESLTAHKSARYEGWEFEGGRVEANTGDNRLRIFFDEKPDEDTRAALKSSGFRWSPNAGAWQRQLTDNALYAAKHLECIRPVNDESLCEDGQDETQQSDGGMQMG